MTDSAKINWILQRRSIRKYTDKKIPEKEIQSILKAAMYAPSAMNKQPWHFVVVDDKSLFAKFMEFHAHASFLAYASHAILVCGDKVQQHDDGFWLLDCGAATQNLLLAAHSLGIGSCWIGIHPREQRKQQTRELFSLPDHVEPFALVSLGYPMADRPLPVRYQQDKIHYNHWGNQS